MPNLTSVKGISNSFEITFVSTAQRQAIFFDPPGIIMELKKTLRHSINRKIIVIDYIKEREETSTIDWT